MISSLTGTVQRTGVNFVVVEASGVGYLVSVTTETARKLHVGSQVFVHTALIVREDAFTLFGFETIEEIELFDLLRSVTGVGPKSALGILSQLSIGAIKDAVVNEKDATFRAVSGIGPKTAKLITVSLAGKLDGIQAPAAAKSTPTAPMVDLANVVQALVGLGWPERSAADAVRLASESLGTSATADSMLRTSLGILAGGKSVLGADQ